MGVLGEKEAGVIEVDGGVEACVECYGSFTLEGLGFPGIDVMKNIMRLLFRNSKPLHLWLLPLFRIPFHDSIPAHFTFIELIQELIIFDSFLSITLQRQIWKNEIILCD